MLKLWIQSCDLSLKIFFPGSGRKSHFFLLLSQLLWESVNFLLHLLSNGLLLLHEFYTELLLSLCLSDLFLSGLFLANLFLFELLLSELLILVIDEVIHEVLVRFIVDSLVNEFRLSYFNWL